MTFTKIQETNQLPLHVNKHVKGIN